MKDPRDIIIAPAKAAKSAVQLALLFSSLRIGACVASLAALKTAEALVGEDAAALVV